jgi:outer membrane protein assembly factor BamD
MLKSGLLAFLGIVLFAGCSSVGNLRRDSAQDQYELARELYARGKYYNAAEAFRYVIFNFSGVSYIDSVQYYLGMCYYNDEDYILAVAEFRRLVQSFPQSTLADDGQFMIGKCYYLSAPDNVGLDQTDMYTAISELENFVEDYPQSPLMAEGSDLLLQCKGRIAQKTFKAGEQYYRMGMHEAARIYLQSVVTDFEHAEWRGCSLFLLAKLDEDEGKLADAESKLLNFIQEFPGHKWEKKAKDELEGIRIRSSSESVASESK